VSYDRPYDHDWQVFKALLFNHSDALWFDEQNGILIVKRSDAGRNYG